MKGFCLGAILLDFYFLVAGSFGWFWLVWFVGTFLKGFILGYVFWSWLGNIFSLNNGFGGLEVGVDWVSFFYSVFPCPKN